MINIHIITPTICRQSLIKTCESVTNQLYQNYRHTVIIDGAGLVLPKHIPVDNKRTFLCEKTHMGCDGHMVRRKFLSSGEIKEDEYLIYLDDDNYFYRTDALLDLANLLEKKHFDIVIFPQYREIRPVQRLCSSENIFYPIIKKNYIDIGNIIHKSFINGKRVLYTNNNQYNADGDFCEEICKLTDSIYVYNCEPIITYI